MERDLRVVIRYRDGGRDLQTPPVEIDEVEPQQTKPKVIYLTGQRGRRQAIQISKITAIHPEVVS